MPVFAVSPEKNRWLQQRMAELGVSEADLEEHFVRAAGAGGQHVNKTATCVWLRHRPSGLEVKCMQERSQSLNRFLARRELLELLARQQGVTSPGQAKAERQRRQKARRARRSTHKYRGKDPATGKDPDPCQS